jgi:hypothetical protein
MNEAFVILCRSNQFKSISMRDGMIYGQWWNNAYYLIKYEAHILGYMVYVDGYAAMSGDDPKELAERIVRKGEGHEVE